MGNGSGPAESCSHAKKTLTYTRKIHGQDSNANNYEKKNRKKTFILFWKSSSRVSFDDGLSVVMVGS